MNKAASPQWTPSAASPALIVWLLFLWQTLVTISPSCAWEIPYFLRYILSQRSCTLCNHGDDELGRVTLGQLVGHDTNVSPRRNAGKCKLQTHLAPADNHRSYKNKTSLRLFILHNLAVVKDSESFTTSSSLSYSVLVSSSLFFNGWPNVFAVMKHISVLIIKRQARQLRRPWVCFIALHCPVQRGIIIIIMLPSLLMDMRLALAPEAGVAFCWMGNGEEIPVPYRVYVVFTAGGKGKKVSQVPLQIR